MEKPEFDEKYNALDIVSREMLQIIALIYEPSTITELLKCITKCGFLIELKHQKKFKAIRKLEYDFLDSAEGKLFISWNIIDFIVKEHCLKNPALNLYRKQISSIYPVKESRYDSFQDKYYINRIIREFRIAFFADDKNELEQVFKLNEDAGREGTTRQALYLGLFHSKFSTGLMQQIPDEYKPGILGTFYHEQQAEEVVSYLEGHTGTIQDAFPRDQMFNMLADAYFEHAELEKLTRLIKNKDIIPGFYSPSIEFLQGNITKAKKLYISEIQRILGRSKKMYCPPEMHGVYFVLAMMAAGEFDDNLLHSTLNRGIKEYSDVYRVFKAYVDVKTGVRNYFDGDFDRYHFSLHEAPAACILMWVIDKNLLHARILKNLAEFKKVAKTAGCEYLAYQYHTVLTIVDKKYKLSPNEEKEYAKMGDKYLDLTTLFKEEAEWKRSFKLLKNIVLESSGKKTAKVDKGQSERLVWFVKYTGACLCFYPKEQVIGKNGKWSKGRPIALKRMALDKVSCMGPVDKQIAACISKEQFSTWGHYYEVEYRLDSNRAMPYFLKHPYLFLNDSPTTPVELYKEELQLIVKKRDSGFEILFPHDFETEGMLVIRETPSRFKVIEVTDAQMRIAKALGKEHKLALPKETGPELKNIIGGLSAMITVHSDIKGGGEAKIDSIKADTRPHIHLLPVGVGIRAEFFVRPFKDTGQYCKPGQGGKTVISEIKGKQKQAIRNLSKEIDSATRIISNCPSMAIRGNHNDIFEFETPDECLEALLDLQEIKDDIVIEWPEGETLRVGRKYSMSDMKVAITTSDDWFDIDASIKIDEGSVLNMQQLFESASRSRFVELSDGKFIALTDDLKRKIEELSGYTYSAKSKSKIHPLNVLAVDELLGDFNTKYDKHWKKQLKKAEDSLSFQPELPSTFQAELRPYQLDGYKWLSRLANWGVGACLADDMGLGKTIQALAVILERASAGPTFIVAPASVCINWINESNKFAPTLNTILFGLNDRKEVINNLKPFDLVVCSYGLLLQESELISKVQWTTTVLDEAQAIKNFKAKRTKAALDLKSEFKLITTGTPVENRLSELWALFSFLNPGLLGTQQEFSARFAIPIERDNDAKMRNSLKKTIRPFLLRRTKNQVLEELPPKTEINISIEMSTEESAFYEALRRSSVAQIESMQEEKGGAVHLRILAELTKLRRACCHPALVTKEINIESSKLSMFIEIVNDLIGNMHKALVFSQFTGYLSIIRDTCDKTGIKYQYLDGATPMKERQKRVDAFQAGDGDVFLISLKAGGVGLNLTAADYVIHMDPWWNPAVEDQASDRAHRIGQQRPVTVYRFVTEGTIEEKIITLHKNKRELVDSLLDGADVSGKMSSNELMALIK